MEEHEQIEKLLPVLKQYWLPILLGMAGIILFAYGLISLLGAANKNEISFSRENSASKSPSLISIDVEGAVVRPGVYKLASNSIIQDALVASGGLSSDADREFVSKNINLASKLTDGAKIYIPVAGESINQAQSANSESETALININTASSGSLDSLPGIGQVTAQKIINNRPYSLVNDLLDKKVVSAKVFSQIKDKITAY